MLAIGIDLGTTSSSVAVFRNENVDIIPNSFGFRNTPSCVVFSETERYVGTSAYYQLSRHHNNAVFDVKRLMGRRFNDPIVQEDMKYWPFTVIDHNGRAWIEVGYKEKTKQLAPEEISAMVLRNLTDTAGSFLGSAVKDVVIAVPTYFNEAQRLATIDAAKIAELNVLRLVNETTAAALTYAFNAKPEGKRNILVYDLGGGGFDVSIVKIESGPKVEVVGSSGDTQLGGCDFDNVLLKHLAEELKTVCGKDVFENKKALIRLKLAVEKAKQELTGLPEATIDIDSLIDGVDFNTTLTRTCFEKLCADWFLLTTVHIEKLLKDVEMMTKDIHEVLLLGGSTRIPKIKRLLEEFFPGIPLKDTINSEDAVANGAAILAASLTYNPHEIRPDIKVNDITPHPIHIITNTSVSTLVSRNNRLPFNKKIKVNKSIDSESIKLIEGEDRKERDNNLLGSFELETINNPTDVSFKIDANGVLEVIVDNFISYDNLSVKVVKKKVTENNIDKMVNEAKTFISDDDKERQRCESRNRLEQYVYWVKAQIVHNNVIDNMKKRLEGSCDYELVWMEENSFASFNALERRLELLQEEYNKARRPQPIEPSYRLIKYGFTFLLFFSLMFTYPLRKGGCFFVRAVRGIFRNVIKWF